MPDLEAYMFTGDERGFNTQRQTDPPSLEREQRLARHGSDVGGHVVHQFTNPIGGSNKN